MRKKQVNNKGLASLLIVSPSTVGGWKKGDYKPDAVSIIKLAELSDSEISAPELFAMVYGQPLPTDRPTRTWEELIETMPIDQLARLVAMGAEKLYGKVGAG